MMVTGRIAGCPRGGWGKLERAAGIGRNGHRELSIVIMSEAGESDAGLVQLLDACQAFSPSFSLADRRQENSRQNGNDGGDAQQFQNRERTRTTNGPTGFHHLSP